MSNIWGYWDCPKCGSTRHRGDIDACPNCGAPRSPDIRFYMDRNNIERVAPELENRQPDWECAYCGCMNGSKDNSCQRCGAARDPDARNYFSAREEPVRGVSDPVHDIACGGDPGPDNFGKRARVAAARSGRHVFIKRRVVALSAVAIGLALIAALCAYLLGPVSGHMRILGMSWSRDIYIDELRTFDESGWELPSGARLKYSDIEIKGYVPVIDHYEPRSEIISEDVIIGWHDEVIGYKDLGNGQFEEIIERVPDYSRKETESVYMEPIYRNEPVLATKYYYQVDRWVESRRVATGGNDKSPEWGDVTLSDKEREGRRAEDYIISGSEGEYHLDYDKWAALDIGDEIEFTYRRLGHKILAVSGAGALP